MKMMRRVSYQLYRINDLMQLQGFLITVGVVYGISQPITGRLVLNLSLNQVKFLNLVGKLSI